MCGLGLMLEYVCIRTIKRDPAPYRGINYCVIGLSQPRYVMVNLVAIRVQEKGGEKSTNVQFICKYEHITQQLHLRREKELYSDRETEPER